MSLDLHRFSLQLVKLFLDDLRYTADFRLTEELKEDTESHEGNPNF